jgi:polar amino acid transport system substrate-binding protein
MGRLWLACVFALCFSPAHAVCERTYVVGLAESGRFVHLDNLQIKGTLLALLSEVSRRTGCEFKLEIMPRARLWAAWDAGGLDIIGMVVTTPERDNKGAFAVLCHRRKSLTTAAGAGPPGQSLESWLDSPARPVLGYIRSGFYGEAVQKLLHQPRYQRQLDPSPDDSTLVRKLFARHVTGILLDRSTFEERASTLGLDKASMSQHDIEEAPSAPFGLYISLANVSASDRQRLMTVIASLAPLSELEPDVAAARPR